MRRQTPFTLDEAKDYLQDTIAVWETNQPKKIIALAGNAYNQRNKASTVSVAAKIKSKQTLINYADKMIAKMMKDDPNADTSRLFEEMAYLDAELESLKTELANTPPKKTKK
jgi:hypothetical protein